jgi:hypothetical protein
VTVAGRLRALPALLAAALIAGCGPSAPPAAPDSVRSSHSPMLWATLPRFSGSDSTEMVGAWNGNF